MLDSLKTKLDLVKICNRFIEYSFYFLFFLVPLIMTPFNYELFEFNKMMLVYFLAAIIVAAWLVKMIIEKKIIFRRTFMDVPFLLFLTSQFSSTLLSIDPHTSFWGFYSRSHGGLLSTIAYLLLYWAFVSNMNQKASKTKNQKIRTSDLFDNLARRFSEILSYFEFSGNRKVINSIFFLLFSSFLVACYGIAEHFGIDAQYWVQDVQNRVFSTLGQPNWLAAYLVALLPIPMAMILEQESKKARKQEKKKNLRLLFYPFTLLLYICLLYTKSRSGLISFTTAYLIFWALIFLFPPKGVNRGQPLRLKHAYTLVFGKSVRLKSFFLLTLLMLLITLFVGTPWTPNLGQIYTKLTIPSSQPDPKFPTQAPPPIPVGGTESGEIRKIVWKGAIDVWRNWPIFGSGVETFAYSYYNFRPREHNDVSEWDFLYNKAHNEYLNFAATTGTVGLLTYLGVIGTFIAWNLKQLKMKNTLNFGFFAGYVGILVTNFFGFSVVTVALFFFLLPAMSLILTSPSQGLNRNQPLRLNHTYTLGIEQKLAISSIIFSLFIFHYSLFSFWYADFLFARGDKLNKARQYEMALFYLQRAVRLRPSEPFYHDALSLAAANLELVDLAISESDQTVEMNPYHLNFWKNRTRVFYALAEIDEKYNQDALDSLLTASELAPTDAKVLYNLGLMYAKIGQEKAALKILERTVFLKPNYHDARYALALFYEEKGDLKKAREQLKYILEKIDPNHELAKEKLKEL